MTEKRYFLKYSEWELSNGKTIQAEPYFIDKKGEFIDTVYFTIDGYPTMSDEQVLDLLNENEQLKKENNYLEALSLGIMLNSTVKSFNGEWDKRYKYSEETDTVYDMANNYGQYHKILGTKEMVLLLNGYSALLENKKNGVIE